MKRLLNKFTPLVTTLAIAVLFASCNTTSTNSADNAQVALRFQTTAAAQNNANFTALAAQNNKLVINGKNGAKLTITDIHFIVDDFELEQTNGECDRTPGNKENDCEEFEKELFLVDLPLNGRPLAITASSIQNGVYNALEFEIDNLDIDQDEDRAEKQRKKTFYTNNIQPNFPNWPEQASMVIKGSFESKSGEVTTFTTFADAEISIEMQLNPPLKISDGIDKQITVNISPADWFTNQDGTVVNLARYDFQKVQEPMEFEVEMEEGFDSVDHD